MSPALIPPVPTEDRGYLAQLRGQPRCGYSPAKHGPMWNCCLLPIRADDDGFILFIVIYIGTWSTVGCAEWARVRDSWEYAPHMSDRQRGAR
jgi:hypothetical protein